MSYWFPDYSKLVCGVSCGYVGSYLQRTLSWLLCVCGSVCCESLVIGMCAKTILGCVCVCRVCVYDAVGTTAAIIVTMLIGS